MRNGRLISEVTGPFLTLSNLFLAATCVLVGACLAFVFRNVLSAVRLALSIALRVRPLRQDDLEFFEHLLDLDLVGVAEVEDRVAELVAHVLQQLNVEVVVCILTLVRSTEARLESECVCNAHFLPHDDACRGLLRLLHLERAVREIEDVQVLVDQLGENLFFHSIVDAA